jgi:tetratricopeptide (TPR) repeat protein
VLLTSYAPQVLTRELIQPAIECLLDAQQSYPNSAFFLFFAGRVSRLARNLPLSTQSFVYTYEVSQGDWAETTMGHLATFEIAFNSAMALDWASAAVRSLELQSKYNSPAFLKYFYGACMEMLGNRTEAILAFAEAPKLIDKKKKSQSEQFIMSRVSFFEVSGFQDLNFSLPAVEILLAWNAFPCMSPEALEKCLEIVESTLERVYEREKLEYDIRTVELVPSTATPDYYDQRGILLLAKASIFNALGRFSEGIVHLNWLIDNKDNFKHTNWLAPFAYW